jgi:hypothetical protein
MLANNTFWLNYKRDGGVRNLHALNLCRKRPFSIFSVVLQDYYTHIAELWVWDGCIFRCTSFYNMEDLHWNVTAVSSIQHETLTSTTR